MIRRIGLMLAVAFAMGGPVAAQTRGTPPPVQSFQGTSPWIVSGSFSAASFAPAGTFATLTATGSSASVALPSGSVVVFSNIGTTAVSCTLGVGSATAVAGQNIVQPASSVAFAVGLNTFGACIDESGSASNVVRLSGGAGSYAGAGGGGSGGGGGAITAASGSYSSGALSSGSVASGAFASGALASGAGTDGWDSTQGAKADAACGTDNGTCSVAALVKRTNQNLTTLNNTAGSSIAAGTNVIGHVIADTGSTTAVTALPATPAGTNLIGNVGTIYPAGSTPITASTTGTTAATTATLAANATLHTYVCGFSIRANATAAVTGNATMTGVVTGTMNFTQWTAPAASGLGVTEQVFSPCIISSATNTAIAVISAAPGTGGVVSVSAWGYQL